MAYLDYNATAPADARVIEAMIPTLAERFGNPSSENHGTGREAAALVEEARAAVAGIVGMSPADVIFTSGATEANNLVFFGLASGLGSMPKVMACQAEHKSVLEPCRRLAAMGASVRHIPVDCNGVADVQAAARMMAESRPDVVSVMMANSETGVIQPVREVAQEAHRGRTLVHCDATQAVGRIPFDAAELGVDIVTLSSHKLYGPKGCGALVATRQARKSLGCMIYGGGQERALRSGTLNVPGIVGFGRACEIASAEWEQGASRQRGLRDYFESQIMQRVPGVTVNGAGAERIPNTSSIRIAGAHADAVIVNAPEIEVATGSACSSSAIEPSHVLSAMGMGADAAYESLRVSVGRQTTREDVDLAVESLARAAEFVRGKEAGAGR